MSRRFGLAALVAAFAVTSGLAHAGRPRSGAVVSPFGPVYNTGSAEWRMAGGNPLLYEQIVEQKMMMQQQQMMLRQQQQMLKANNGKAAGLASPAGGSRAAGLNVLPPAQRKKKRRTYVPTGNTAKAEAEKSATPAKAAKPSTTP